MKYFITGINGFIGQSLATFLVEKNHTISGSVRASSSYERLPSVDVYYKELSVDEVWGPTLNDIDTVIHTAARVHVFNEVAVESLKEFQNINTASTLNLAQQAADAGVGRFILISSIGVNGNQNSAPFVESDLPAPKEPYAVSKYEAEIGLQKISEATNMEIVIVRPPLVYGENAPGNFLNLLRCVKHCIPMPLGRVNNKRSFIALDNLVDFIALCADKERSPLAADQVFVISDDEDVSTTQLLRKIAKAYDKRQWLIPVPVSWMRFVAKIFDKQAMADKLFGNLQIDCSKAKNLLGWKPIITMDEQLKKMADAEK